MEEEKYKMIYSRRIKKKLEDMIKYGIKEQKIKDELESNKIRILGHDFVKNNKNKAKLIINNKKCNLEEFINSSGFISNEIKIGIILYKELSNISYIFENCIKLKELSITDIDFIDDKEPEPEDFYDFINQDFDSIDIYKDNSLYLKKSIRINYDNDIEESEIPFKKYNENLYLLENIIHLKRNIIIFLI